jgi:hypothetical protein
MRPSGQLPGIDRVADRGVLADAEYLGQVQRIEPGGHGLGELVVDPQPLVTRLREEIVRYLRRS